MKRENKADTDTKTTHSLKHRLTLGIVATLIALAAVVSATYAWYIYNTGRHTTNVQMAAGAGANLQISNSYDGEYSSATVLESFAGQLVPVSTDNIENGFQKVKGFTRVTGSREGDLASSFQEGEPSDYYHTSLYLRTNGSDTDIYLSDIGFEDSDEDVPISSAIRVGLVVHEPGRANKISGEYIFAISDRKNPEADYNTATGREGYVLDSTRTDGTTIPFTPYNTESYCIYNKDTGAVTLKQNSLKLCTISGKRENGQALPGEAVEVDIYIWLEGCDEDCTANLCRETLKNLSVSFAGVVRE